MPKWTLFSPIFAGDFESVRETFDDIGVTSPMSGAGRWWWRIDLRGKNMDISASEADDIIIMTMGDLKKITRGDDFQITEWRRIIGY